MDLTAESLAALLVASAGRKTYRAALKGKGSLSTYLKKNGPIVGRLQVHDGDLLRLTVVEDEELFPQKEVSMPREEKFSLEELVLSWRRRRQGVVGVEEPSESLFICGDIFDTSERWATASVIVANVLLFDKATLARLADLLCEVLRPGAFVVTTAPFFFKDDVFTELHAGLWCRSSWTGGAMLTIYQRKK